MHFLVQNCNEKKGEASKQEKHSFIVFSEAAMASYSSPFYAQSRAYFTTESCKKLNVFYCGSICLCFSPGKKQEKYLSLFKGVIKGKGAFL